MDRLKKQLSEGSMNYPSETSAVEHLRKRESSYATNGCHDVGGIDDKYQHLPLAHKKKAAKVVGPKKQAETRTITTVIRAPSIDNGAAALAAHEREEQMADLSARLGTALEDNKNLKAQLKRLRARLQLA